MMVPAVEITASADVFCVIGTSLVVYPAASLLHYVPNNSKIFLIDPNPPSNLSNDIFVIKNSATLGVAEFVKILKK